MISELKINDKFLIEKVKEKYLVIDCTSLNIYTFNGAASLILNEILDGKSIKNIVYELSNKIEENFINEFINELIKIKLILIHQ